MEKTFPSSGENELIQLLLKRQAELNSLLEVTQAINKNTAASVLFEMLEVVLTVHLKVGTMRLLIKDMEHYYCASRFGGEFEKPKALQQICQLVQGNETITELKNHAKKVLNQYDYFVPVFHKDEMLAFVLLGDFDTRPELISNDLNFIETLINVIIVALENKKLFKERVDRERLQRDIELASEVQNMLFPQSLPKTGFVEVGATYLPSQNIGGDYFDFIWLNKDEFLWCIADVSGKGISAALLMANLQAGLRAWATVENDLTKVIKQLNKIVFANTKGERFITMFVGRYNKESRQLQFVNAGHNAPILVNGSEHIFLNSGTTIIGAFDELPFVNMGTEVLGKGSLIFNYTDGLVESSDEDIYIDDSELADFLVLNSDLPVDELNNRMLANIKTTKNARMDSDDVTLFSIRIL
ncbi:MAG TPA: PP2C family protein-serine/threonine phosphatase [Sphingobacteriaceae bacterium]|nr:PP2C family protein-serine/threonine phosphatase [Sphingobacteriaceae bacterium]